MKLKILINQFCRSSTSTYWNNKDKYFIGSFIGASVKITSVNNTNDKPKVLCFKF